MEPNQLAEAAAIAINNALDTCGARAVPGRAAVVELTGDANRPGAIDAVRAAFTAEQLHSCPVMLWHGPAEVLIGPSGALVVNELVPNTRSLDVRIHSSDATATHVVVSWLDGPSGEEVAARLANTAAIGLEVRLVREELDQLLADVIDAAYTSTANRAQIGKDPVLERVAAVRDGRDIYHYLLEVGAELLSALKRRRSSHYRRIFTAMGELDDQIAVDAVLDDLDAFIVGGELFQVHATDDQATLAALFTLVALAARAAGPQVRASAREDVLLP